MEKYIKDNKGFTLVELLAVIVILVLIMGLAFYSLQGVIGNVEISSAKATATQYIEGVRKMLLVDKMAITAGDYYVSDKMLEKKVKSPWGEYQYYTGSDTTITANLNDMGYAEAGAAGTLKCGGSNKSGSFIRVTTNASGDYVFYACLYDSANHYIHGTEETLNSNTAAKSDYHMINSSDTEITD